jgi:hypothetical protein
MNFHLFGINKTITSYSILTPIAAFDWNENFDYIVIDILKDNWNSHQIMLFHCSKILAIKMLPKKFEKKFHCV